MRESEFEATAGCILIVDDDADTRQLIADCLAPKYTVVPVATAKEALDACRRDGFHLALVDVRLPGMSGLSLVPRLKEVKPDLRIMLMTAYPQASDAVQALRHLRVDDYVEKPFSPRDLVQRIEEALAHVAEVWRLLRLGDLTIDCLERQVVRGGVRLSLAPREVDMLIAIARAGRTGREMHYEELMREVWGYEPAAGDREMVRVAMSRLRRKLGDDRRPPRYIETERGAGYRTVSLPDTF